MGKAKIISVINYKGGVGKTVSTFNIGIGLNIYEDASILLIDLDPQCSLSEICMKAYSRTYSKRQSLKDLKEDQSINYVFKSYLNQEFLDFPLRLDLNHLIKKNFYLEKKSGSSKLDFIPGTYYGIDEETIGGLDEIEREILWCNLERRNSLLVNTSLLAKFLKDHHLDQIYDYIIFDCPPANNLITQNALVVSDYYLIPTIMDDMSTRGVGHIRNVIKKTYVTSIRKQYQTLIELSPDTSFLSFYKKDIPKNLGVFETLRKSSCKTNEYRDRIVKDLKMPLFESVILNYKGISEEIGQGKCSLIYYKGLVQEIVNKLKSN